MVLPFFDSNVILYAFSEDERSTVAKAALADGGVISVQTLNECVNVLRRKQKRDWPEVLRALRQIRRSCPAPLQLTVEMHHTAVSIARRHGVPIYDAMIIAAALVARCDTLLSEDLQDGRVFDSQLTVRNPFAT